MKTIKFLELRKLQTDFVKVKLNSSRVAADYIRQFFRDDIEIFESAFILNLNRANMTIGYAKLSQGGVSGTVIDPKMVAKFAIDDLASSVILCHNHPSGNLQPSGQDDDLTKKIKEGLKLLDIHLADHLILTADGYYSYSDEGRL